MLQLFYGLFTYMSNFVDFLDANVMEHDNSKETWFFAENCSSPNKWFTIAIIPGRALLPFTKPGISQCYILIDYNTFWLGIWLIY